MILRFLCGLLLGAFFYGGLWLTVRHLSNTRHPFTVTLGSLFIRTGVTLAGFFFLIGGHWQNALWALLGFTAARFLLGGTLQAKTPAPQPESLTGQPCGAGLWPAGERKRPCT